MTETRQMNMEIKGERNQTFVGVQGDAVFGAALSRRVSRERITDDGSDQNHNSTLRKGKWTAEEEDYVNKIISLFNRGLLPIPAGTTLRTYLSETLHCDPMRITKKFAGASCIGKQVFQPVDGLSSGYTKELDELEMLKTCFHRRVCDRFGALLPNDKIMPVRRPSMLSLDDNTDADTSSAASSFSSQSSPQQLTFKFMRDGTDSDVVSSRSRYDQPPLMLAPYSTSMLAPSSISTGRRGLAYSIAAAAGMPRSHVISSSTNASHMFGGGSGSGSGGSGSPADGPFRAIKRVVSAPDLSELCRMRDVGEQGKTSGRKRSISVTNFEQYCDDDHLAGDLLLQFAGIC